MPDGSVTFSVNLDAKEAHGEMSRLKKKIMELEAELQTSPGKKNDLEERLRKAAQAADEAKARVDALREAGANAGEIKEAEARAKALDAEFNKAADALDKYHAQIANTEHDLEKQKVMYGAIAKSAEEVNQHLEETPLAVKSGTSAVERFEKRIVSLAKRVFVFSMITSALRSLRGWFIDVIKADKDAVAAIAQLKGALLTLVQPLVSVVIPAFTTFIQVLTRVVGALASVVSAIFGTTAEKSAAAAENLEAEKKALGGVGAAAKKAGKSLASFDEINQLSGGEETAGGGAGAATASAEIEPDFSFLDGAKEKLQEIADLVLFIGSGFALWKLGSFLGELAQAFPALSNLLEPLGDVATKLGGIVIGVAGVMLAWNGLKDAWENGVNWGSMAEMIGGVALAAIGLGAAFGPVATGIALIVGGLAMLVTGFHDAMESGWNLQNTLLSIAGLLATGLGFSFITGSVIPLVIGAIAALLLAVTVATGHGEELISGIQGIIQGFLDFFTGIFTGDMEKAIGGIDTMFEGLKTAIGAIIDGIKDFFLGFLDWLDEKTGGRFHDIIKSAKDIVNDVFDTLGGTVDGLIQALKGFVTFLTGVFTADFDLAWEGVKQIFTGFVNAILAFWGGGINLIIKALNFVIDKLNGISFDVPDWVPGIGGNKVGVNIPMIQEYQIPKLAAGAVIPPNREFLAVLGDQQSGNNIEAPEALLRQMAADAASANTALLQRIISLMESGRVLVVNDTTFAELVYNSNNNARNRHGSSLVTVRSMG